jgi:S1-C subfamily serine protease
MRKQGIQVAVAALALAAAPALGSAGVDGGVPAAAPVPAAVAAPAAVATPAPTFAPPPAPEAPYCPGEYADDLSALSPRAREFEARQSPYTYCIRTSAVYECPSYAPDGALRKTRKKVVAHGTGFGYRQTGNDTLIVTNDHVAEWPAVTDADHPVDDVPAGCKRVSDTLRVVDSESDQYERDDVPLTRVVADPQLDVAVPCAKAPLPVVPWKLGRSAALRERNVVDVRGFPLGVLRANNVGKVVSAFERDDDREWEHDDFVVDALLSPGNSGSPVFAVSCRTGELELVGVYHAAYVQGSALNAVVGVDQLRDLLATLKRAPRARPESPAPLDAAARALIVANVRPGVEPFFPFGPLAAAVRGRDDGAVVFEVMARDFPLRAQPVLVVEDLPPPSGAGFGMLGRIWAGNGQALWPVERSALDGEARSQLVKLVDALRRDAVTVASYRDAAPQGAASRERFQEVARLERTVARNAAARTDLAQTALELAERLAPQSPDAPVTLGEALAPLPPPVPPPAPAVAPAPEAAPVPAAAPPAAPAAAPIPVASSAAPGAERRRDSAGPALAPGSASGPLAGNRATR